MDVDDDEEDKIGGRKKVKKDIIAEIREKKFKEMKEKQMKRR